MVFALTTTTLEAIGAGPAPFSKATLAPVRKPEPVIVQVTINIIGSLYGGGFMYKYYCTRSFQVAKKVSSDLATQFTVQSPSEPTETELEGLKGDCKFNKLSPDT